MKRIVITGAKGLIGSHTHMLLHAENCAAQFKGMSWPYDIQSLGHAAFLDNDLLHNALRDADAVLHFAGVNRADDAAVEAANPEIADILARACKALGVKPHIVYANSIHAEGDTSYGRSKRIAGEILSGATERFTNLILPHIFGEGARPFYNNVTSTLIHQLIAGDEAEVNPDGVVHLVHAGRVAQAAVDAVNDKTTGVIKLSPHSISVPDLYLKLRDFHDHYCTNVYPDLSDPFDLELFNCYRVATYPAGWPRELKLNSDSRGTLFEAFKCDGGGGQAFFSTTAPGVTRGDHFHLKKVERFLVVKGQATIRIRKVLSDEIWEYKVSGALPAPVDMPTLHTHSIENTGTDELLTLFWTHDLFDPEHPDTFADKVLA